MYTYLGTQVKSLGIVFFLENIVIKSRCKLGMIVDRYYVIGNLYGLICCKL